MKELKRDLRKLQDMRRNYTVAMMQGLDVREFLNALALSITRLEDFIALAEAQQAGEMKSRIAASITDAVKRDHALLNKDRQ